MPDLARHISAETFQLGCTPIVNLFSQRADPIALTNHTFEYPVVPDRRRPLALEVYSVDRVIKPPSVGETEEYRPFFSVKHAGDRARGAPSGTCRPAAGGGGHRGRDRGTEVYLSLVDLQFRPPRPPARSSRSRPRMNRDLPGDLPYGV
ncbi:MAG: type VI secretion system baseplate subunit TssF [Isosphaeraceae bacterium]